MAKYYQHIDPSDELFQDVTKLLYIDDDDPDMRIYVFDDGSKCNENFIGRLNDMKAFENHMVFVEVSSAKNVWRFNKKEIVANKQFATGKDGQQYEIPDLYLYDHNTEKKLSFDSIEPKMVTVDTGSISDYVLSNIKSGVVENPEINVSRIERDLGITIRDVVYSTTDDCHSVMIADAKEHVAVQEPKTEFHATIQEQPYVEGDVVADDCIYFDNNGELNIDIDGIMQREDQILHVTYNGRSVPMMLKDFVCAAMQTVEEKVVVKEVEVNSEFLEIEGKGGAEYNLVDNMINMSKKDECTINMELDIMLPPVSVYELIKNAYSNGMTTTFVKILANNMSMQSLRLGVEAGLKGYYDQGVEPMVATMPAITDK